MFTSKTSILDVEIIKEKFPDELKWIQVENTLQETKTKGSDLKDKKLMLETEDESTVTKLNIEALDFDWIFDSTDP